ncbi:MAG: hypothetical protein EBT47_06640 [Chloroflexi bacterium]|nr:hypothetical protein [Chloroflexota bacterium]
MICPFTLGAITAIAKTLFALTTAPVSHWVVTFVASMRPAIAIPNDDHRASTRHGADRAPRQAGDRRVERLQRDVTEFNSRTGWGREAVGFGRRDNRASRGKCLRHRDPSDAIIALPPQFNLVHFSVWRATEQQLRERRRKTEFSVRTWLI